MFGCKDLRRFRRGIQKMFDHFSLCHRNGMLNATAAMVHPSMPQAAGHFAPFL
jgi:hypothetical protein